MPDPTNRRINWPRIFAEGVVIIASILLALAADAWWEERQERADERASLELLDRDLSATMEQLQEFEELMAGSTGAAIAAYVALSGPREAIDENAISNAIIRAGNRRTVRIPSAAYTDLVSTGRLQVIGDRQLRDQIVRFYEAAQRSQQIIEANNLTFIDGLVLSGIHGRGLILPRPVGRTGAASIDAGMDAVRNALGEDFAHQPDPLWEMPSASPEWDTVRGTMLQLSKATSASRLKADNVVEGASDLRSAIGQALAR